MSIYEWELKQKPRIKFVRLLPQNGERNVWVCSNRRAGGWGRSREDAYRAFKGQQETRIETSKLLANMAERWREEEKAGRNRWVLTCRERGGGSGGAEEEYPFPIQGFLALVVFCVFCVLVF